MSATNKYFRVSLLSLLAIFVAALLTYSPVVFAQEQCATGNAGTIEACIQNEIRQQCSGMSADAAERCAAQLRAETTTASQGNFEADCKSGNLNKDNCGIIAYIVLFTRVLSGLVGIVVVIMIAVGGIQYAAAGPDPSAVVAARKRIINALIALVFYIFMFSFLQWLVPGGIF